MDTDVLIQDKTFSILQVDMKSYTWLLLSELYLIPIQILRNSLEQDVSKIAEVIAMILPPWQFLRTEAL